MTTRTDALLTEQDVARRLALQVATLRRWRWAGRGPRFAKIGAAVRYDPGDVDAYIAQQMRRSTSDPGEHASAAADAAGRAAVP